MSGGILWLAALAFLPLSGTPLIGSPRLRRFSLPCRLALAAGVGALLVSVEMTALAIFGIRWNLPALIAGAFLIACGIFALPVFRGGAGTGPDRGPASAAGTWMSAAAILVVTASVLAGADTSGDLVLFWGPKAQAFGAARTIDVAYLKEPILAYLHPCYPPLVTNTFAFASMLASRFSWRAATLTFPLLLAALAVGLHGILRTRLPLSHASALAAVLVSAIAVMGMEADIAGNGEMPLLFFETLAMALLVSAEGESSIEVLAGLLLAGAACSKVEGLTFVLATAALYATRRKRPGRSGVLVRLLVPTIVALGLWFAFGHVRRVFEGYEGYGEFWKIYPGAMGNVLASIGLALWRTGYGLPFLVPLLVWLSPSGTRSRRAGLPLGVAAALTAFFVFTYLHQPDAALWIRWSAARIFSPLIPLFVLSAADSAGEDRSLRAANPAA